MKPHGFSADGTPRPRDRGDDPRAVEVHRGADYTAEEVEFMMAMDRYKRTRGRPYPTWPEVLTVLHSLGYRKVAAAAPPPGARQGGGAHGPHLAPPGAAPCSGVEGAQANR